MRREVQANPARRSWKQTITEGLYRTGVLRAVHGLSKKYELRSDAGRRVRLRPVSRAKYVVLTYHRVGTEGVPLYCTLPRHVFAEQMAYLARHFRVISIQQMAEELKDPDRTGQALAISFDDGYLGTYTEAFPVLQRFGLPATVYLTAGAVESGETLWYDRIFLRFQKADTDLYLTLDTPRTFRLTGYQDRIGAAAEVVGYLRTLPDDRRQRWCEEFEATIPLPEHELRGAMMTWEHARVMQRSGISFGAHTMTHPVVSRLSSAPLRDELKGAKLLIEEKLECAVEHFAFPFGKPGECGVQSSEVLASLGYRSAMTSIAGVNEHGADPFRLRRLGVGDSCSIAYFALQLHRLLLMPTDEEVSASVPLGAENQTLD